MTSFKKLLTVSAVLLFAGVFAHQTWALDKTELQKPSFFHFLTDTKTGKPYSLEFKEKKTIPVFVSRQSAETLEKIIETSSSQTFSLETLDPEEFSDFLKTQESSGIPVHIFPYSSNPQYNAVRPMTWGVGSSYLFGAALVLFLFWAITRSARKN